MFDKVAVKKCATYDRTDVGAAIDGALELIGGLDFVHEGMTIGIKANLVSGMAPDKAVTTHPAVLRHLCMRIVERGASVIIGDSPGGLYTAGFVKNIYKSCGLNELEQEFDGKVKLNVDFSVTNIRYNDAVSIKDFSYTGWLDKVDAIINFSKLKTHAMMGMSCAVKNMFGTVPGTVKTEYHMRFPEEMAFANVMVDLNEFFKPALYLVDAIDGMEGNGPTMGEKRHIGAILASRHPYALDMVCAGIIGMGIKDVQTIRAAAERGLGPRDIKEVEIAGESNLSQIRVNDFKRATIHQSITFEGGGFVEACKSVFIKTFYSTKPQVSKDECVGCQKCSEVCPAGAITMRNNLPDIDRSKCIKCFCCQEFCPKGAMKVHKNPVGQILNGLQGSKAKCEKKNVI